MALGSDLVVIGRDIETLGIRADDPRLSRVHARVAYDDRAGKFRITDTQSRNGTFVNGRSIDTALLSDGDVIRMGNTLIVYAEGDPARELRMRAEQLAGTGISVLLQGETGTGKEVLARLIHACSGRKGPFVAVNCASIPAPLASAEFFGHTKQAFSGAVQNRSGLLVAAQGGTILLDELGDCPLDVQAALLRAVQERRVRPIGATSEVPIDVRIVAATHTDLEAAMAEGRFRADLYSRLAQVTLVVPPLRARRASLLELARELAPNSGLNIAPDAAEALLLWDWPFNVRELQSFVTAFCALHEEEELDLAAVAQIAPKIAARLSDRRREGSRNPAAERQLQVVLGRARLGELLRAHGGNVSAVAAELRKPRVQVYRWMRSMGLSAETFRR